MKTEIQLTAIRMFYSLRRMLMQTHGRSYAEWDELPESCRQAWLRAARERFI